MRAFAVAVLAGVLMAGLSLGQGVADESDREVESSADAWSEKSSGSPIVVKLVIREEQDGKQVVLQRPRIMAAGGRPAVVQFGNMLLELVAVAEPETSLSPTQARLRKSAKPEVDSPSSDVPIHVSLSIKETEEGQIRTRSRFQLRTLSGETSTVKTGGLEVQVTAELVPTDPEVVEFQELQAAERAELRIYRILQKRISAPYDQTPLKEAVKDLAARCGVNFVIDPSALEEEGLTPVAKVTAPESSVRVCTLLDQLLAPLLLDYVVIDEVIKITSRRRAQGELVAKIYPVADLLSPAEATAASDAVAALPPIIREGSPDELCEQITTQVAPESWDTVGGPGGMRYFKGAKSLVVRQTPDVHDEIAQLLGKLRAERLKVDSDSRRHVE
ncbi:MAG: hypothetical protein EXS05_24280 [Planctomycetaceae bacterium]|nr:hypothetical protein [Planctomycetaceae bacterium]